MNFIAYLTLFLFQSATPDWQVYKSTPEADVYFRNEACHDEANGIHREYVLLKFVNKTDHKLKLSWQLERYEAGTCTTCNKNEYAYSLTMEPHQTLEADCASKDRELKVFVKHLDLPNPKAFSKFELSGFSAETTAGK